MPNYTCRITAADLGGEDPTTSPDFINPNYVEPDYLRPWYKITIFVGDTGYDFSPHYRAQSFEDELVFGARGIGSLYLNDFDKSAFNLPFIPVRDQRITIEDETEQEFILDGYINNVFPETVGTRADGTPIQLLRVEFEDSWGNLESITYNEVYLNKTHGFILRDAGQRAGFDISEIDPDLGFVETRFDVSEDTPATVFERISALLDLTYWVEPGTKKIFVYNRDHAGPLIREFNDDRDSLDYWANFFLADDLSIQPDTDGYATQIIMVYNQRLDTGTANFENGSDVVLGFSGNENWYLLPHSTGLSIENQVTGNSYRIKKNNSDSDGVNELILESDYRESTATDVPYTIIGGQDKIVIRNPDAVSRRAELRGDSGILSKKIVFDNTTFFRADARRIAQAELNISSRDLILGEGVTDNYRFPCTCIWPGKTVSFNLPLTKRLVGITRIESLRRKDVGGGLIQPDGRKIQKMEYTIGFTPAVSRDQLRMLQKAVRKSGATPPGTDILDVEFTNSVVAFKDCLHVVEPLKQQDASIAEFEAALVAREVELKQWLFAPATDPDDQAHFVGATKFSNFS